jgi:deoxyhypusine monooxygenase
LLLNDIFVGEALGAIADESALPSLELHINDSAQEVSETCRLAINRIKYTKNKDSFSEKLTQNPYYSVGTFVYIYSTFIVYITDPAPPLPMETTKNVDELRAMLTNENTELWMRYRAMFALRNIGTREAVLALADGLWLMFSCSCWYV